jgi:hypothetical protein
MKTEDALEQISDDIFGRKRDIVTKDRITLHNELRTSQSVPDVAATV